MGYIEGEDRNQIILFPESIDEYVSDNNSIRIIDEYIKQLDLEILGFKRAVNPLLGRPPYHPKDMLKLYLYGYLNRVRSSRRLEQEAIRNLEVIWLIRKLKPDFKTIADFRKDNKKALKKVFRDFTKLCDEWELFGKELVAIDGSKFRACNSKKNNYSSKKLERHLKYLDEKIENYIQELDHHDRAEASLEKPDVNTITKRIQQLRDRKEKYESYIRKLKQSGENEISTTDPDSRLMANHNNVEVSYNIQTTVDAKHKLIADFKVTQKPNDLGELDNMALRAKKLFGNETFEVLADKGYYQAKDLKKCAENGITVYITKQTYANATKDPAFYSDQFKYDKTKNTYLCPAGKELHCSRARKKDGKIIGYEYRNDAACKKCEFKARCTSAKKGRSICRHADQDFLDRIDSQTKRNMEKYKLRQMIVEHPFGTIKRGWGAYYFLTKRKVSVSAEISLSFLAYNFKRAINILGTEEILRRLRQRREVIPV
ncbi:MAG: IS1182 family transposase [Candidatus Atribacteria bacterium]|nr:IS1182 family transposase [Candidatus Atribacteria bacterium]